MTESSSDQSEKASTTLPGTDRKDHQVSAPQHAGESADRRRGRRRSLSEIRIANVLRDEVGDEAALKPGAPVEVTIEAASEDTTKKKD